MAPPGGVPGDGGQGGSTPLSRPTGGMPPRKNGGSCAVLHLRTPIKRSLMNHLEQEVKNSREGGPPQLRRAGASFKAGQRPGECSSARTRPASSFVGGRS